MDTSRSHNSGASSLDVADPRRICEITPLRGHTMKEYDEKLSQLKKENFKLKLRIYFLEEGSSSKSAFSGKEDPEILIKYEELKNEAALTRNELNEKQCLLFDAMMALDAMEEKLAEEQRQRSAEITLFEERIMQLEKELESARCSRSPLSLSEYDYSNPASNSNSHEALSSTNPRAFVAVAAHVRDLQEQVSGLELALRDETANSTRLREQLKMEREIRNHQDEEISLRFQNSEEQAATILKLTIDLQRHRERCADLQDALVHKEKLKFQLEEALRDREARVVELEAELDRFRAVEVADKATDTRSIPCLSLQNSQQSLEPKTRQWTEPSESNDAAAELSRLRIDYNLALQNMARFLRRSRMQQAALERAERREQQLLDEIRELGAACSAAKTDLGCIKDQLNPVVRSDRLPSVSPSTPDPDSGDYAPVSQRSRTAVVRSAPSLLSWVLQSLSQNPEEIQHQVVNSEEEHLRQMQLVGILALLSRMATVVNNMVDMNPEGRRILQNITEAAILLCSSSSDLQPASRIDESAILLNHTAHRRGGCDYSTVVGQTNKIGNTKRDPKEMINNCNPDFLLPKEKTSYFPDVQTGTNCLDDIIFRLENLPDVAEMESDVTSRMKLQVVPQSETLENGISSATLIPCVTHRRKSRPVMNGEDASSYMLLQDAWFQLEEARLLCEKLELEAPPLVSDAKFAHSTQKTTPPKTVCDVATQAVPQTQLIDFHCAGMGNSLKHENMELRNQLRRSRRVLQQTYAQLAAANERKRLVEDVICGQLSGFI